MRLIDADELKNQEVLEKLRTAEFDDEIEDVIGKIPTAYSVDKVVERLEENAKYFQSEADELAQVGDWGTATELQGKAAAYKDAAKTVKSGGIE